MNLSRFKAFWRTLPSRVYATHIDFGEAFTILSTKATFPVNQALQDRIAAARKSLGETQPKADRK